MKYSVLYYVKDSLRGSSVKLGTVQIILGWLLRKDDTQNSRSVNIIIVFYDVTNIIINISTVISISIVVIITIIMYIFIYDVYMCVIHIHVHAHVHLSLSLYLYIYIYIHIHDIEL